MDLEQANQLVATHSTLPTSAPARDLFRRSLMLGTDVQALGRQAVHLLASRLWRDRQDIRFLKIGVHAEAKPARPAAGSPAISRAAATSASLATTPYP